jgi:hypothetical protein
MKTRKENKMNSIWLGAMIISYLACILTIIGGSYYDSIPTTVSSTLANEKTNFIIFSSMLSMGFFTIMYESGRKCWVSFMAILLLLIGIYGVILIEETEPIHYVFASTAFISILVFMGWNSFVLQRSNYRIGLCMLNFVLMLFLFGCILSTINDNKWFLICEVLFIAIFAIFYLSL